MGLEALRGALTAVTSRKEFTGLIRGTQSEKDAVLTRRGRVTKLDTGQFVPGSVS